MNRTDLMRLSFKNFLRRKVRTTLTILGVVIGTSAIVVMVSLGIGMNESFKQQVSSMGSLGIITVSKYDYSGMPQGGGQAKEVKLNDQSVKKFALIEGVDAVTPILLSSLKFGSGKYVAPVNIIGIDPSEMGKFDFKLSSGRLLSKDDTNSIVFGSNVPMQFYNPKNMGSSGFYTGMGDNQKGPVDVLKDKLIMTTHMSYGEKKQSGIIQDDNKPTKIYKAVGVGLLAGSNDEKSWSAYMNIEYLKKLMIEKYKKPTWQKCI